MGTKTIIPRVALAAVPILVILTLLMGVKDARAQATITGTVGAAEVPYLTTGGPYGWVDLTATGATDVQLQDSGPGTDLDAGGTVSLTLDASYEWVPGACVGTVSGGGGTISFAYGGSNQVLVVTLNGAAIPANGTIDLTVLAARCVATVQADVAAVAPQNTTNTFNSLTDGAWATSIEAVEGPSVAFDTPVANGADSTDLADGDGGWDFDFDFTITDANGVMGNFVQLWWSVDSSLTQINDEEGAFRAQVDSTNVEVFYYVGTAGNKTPSILTAGMSDWDVYNTEYYVYATCQGLGDMKIGRAGPIRVFHYPTNDLDQDDPNSADTSVDFTSNDDDYLDSGLLLAVDDGTQNGGGSETVSWTLQTIDFDHNADVHYYYSASSTLTEADLVLAGEFGTYTVTGLTGATAIVDTLEEDIDLSTTWDIYDSDDDFVPAGDYYIYVVSNDGYHQDVDVSSDRLFVRHSPLLVMANPFTTNAGVTEWDLRPDVNRYFNINWGETVAGDRDPDQNSTIAFYLDSDTDGTADFDQTSITTLTNATTRADDDITNGELIYSATITEDPDHQLNNNVDIDMWAWSEALRASINTRVAAADNIFVYGIITSGTLSRITTYAGEDVNYVITAGEDISNTLTSGAITGADLTVTNAPDAFVTDPPDLGGFVGWGESYRVAWDFAWDFGETAGAQDITLFLSDVDMRTESTFDGTYGTGVVGLADLSNDLWVINSTDGTVGNEVQIAGASFDGFYDFRPDQMTGNSIGGAQTLTAYLAAQTPPNEGELFVYLVINQNGATVAPDDADIVFQAPGGLYVTSTSGPTSFGYRVLPYNATVVEGDTVSFSIYPNSGIANAEIAAVFMAVDTTYWDLATPSAPFSLNTTNFTAANVVENSNDQGNVSGGHHHLNLVYGATGSAEANLNGGTNELATLSLIAKRSGMAGIEDPVTAEIHFEQDLTNDRYTCFYNGNTNPMPVTVQLPAARAENYPRGELQGNVNLQGVTDYSGLVAYIDVRPSGAAHGIDQWDSVFAAANDDDTVTPGLQVNLDTAGHYHLTDVPNGEYDVAVRVDGWVSGTIDAVVQHGDHIGDVDPIYTSLVTQDITTQRLQLPAGDCAGYTDSTDTVRPDNQITTTDLTAVKNAYDSTADSTAWNILCDFDRDGWVYLPDLNFVNSNLGTNGVPLIYREGGLSNVNTELKISDLPEAVVAGQEIDVVVELLNAADVRAFDVRLQLAGFQVVSVDNHMLLGGYSQADYISRVYDGEYILAGAMNGHDELGYAGSDELLSLRLRATRDMRVNVQISNGDVINTSDELEHAALNNDAVLPADYVLGQAYPNPFNPTTHINFELPQNDFVRLTVFNMLGQEVAVLVNEEMTAGRYEVMWNGLNKNQVRVASGLYVYRMEAGNFSQSHKMILMK